MNKQKQMFKRFNQSKHFDFEQMKKNFNINFIEARSFFLNVDFFYFFIECIESKRL